MAEESIASVTSDQKIKAHASGDLMRPTKNDEKAKSYVWYTSVCGFKLDHPPTVVLVSECETETDFNEPRHWQGTEEDVKLFELGRGTILEIRDHSCLIFKIANCELAAGENPKILIPYDVAQQIGFSKLANLGAVAQRNSSTTFIMEKADLMPSAEECKDSHKLYLKDQLFLIKCIPDETHKPGSIAPEDLVRPMFTWSQWPSIFRTSVRQFCTFRIIFFALITRCIFAAVNQQYDLIDTDGIWRSVRTVVTNCPNTILDYISYWDFGQYFR